MQSLRIEHHKDAARTSAGGGRWFISAVVRGLPTVCLARITPAIRRKSIGYSAVSLSKIKPRHHCACFCGRRSLGGNALLKWLGEQGKQASQLARWRGNSFGALDLAAAGRTLASGFNLLYTRHFLDTLKGKALEKLDRFPGLFDAHAVAACRTLYEFDNLVTAPLHGFRNTEDYWNRSSSKPWLKHIHVPTLVINALNDPFMPPSALPRPQEVSPR